MKKVTLREQIEQIFVNAGIYAIPECDDDYLKSIRDEILAVVDSFLEPSPQTTEMQKLLENLYEEIKDLRYYESQHHLDLVCVSAVLTLLDKFVPKLEAFFADHVSREKLRKLHNDLKIKLDFELEELGKRSKDIIGKKKDNREVFMFNIQGDRVRFLRDVLERLELLTKKGGE